MGRSVRVAKIGRKGFNSRKALADVVTEFLEIISHTVLFNYSGYPAEMFYTAGYGDILIHKCRVKEVLDYVSSALQTIHRWIRLDKLSHFAACILDKNNKVLMEAVIIIMGVRYSHLRDLLISEAVDMKQQFQKTIFTLQRGSYVENMKNVFRNEEIRFEIHTKLRGNCEVKLKRRAEDFKWERCDQCAPVNLRPCGRRIDTKLVEIIAMVRQLDKT